MPRLAERIARRVVVSHSAFLDAARRRDALLAQKTWSDYLFTTSRMLVSRDVRRQPIDMAPLWRAQAGQALLSRHRGALWSLPAEIRARIAEGRPARGRPAATVSRARRRIRHLPADTARSTAHPGDGVPARPANRRPGRSHHPHALHPSCGSAGRHRAGGTPNHLRGLPPGATAGRTLDHGRRRVADRPQTAQGTQATSRPSWPPPSMTPRSLSRPGLTRR